jgi:outer membrane lipoprotein-sorting protein
MEDRVRQVMLEVTPEQRIVRILVHGSDDSITEYRLNNQRENVEVPDSKFRFTAPPGTEIVEDETGQ